MSASFLFYDLETYGADPRRTRIAQFAGLRTDDQLRQIDEPVSFYVRPADDVLPSPMATMITGISPQHAQREGISEAEAFARISELMGQPETCSLGWNTLRFDDEFIRHGMFRNFYDAYEREWRGGNSRWDLLDVARLFHAIRPEGVNWPQREDGKGTSFKLEHLAIANDVREGDAHEAMSDVLATLGIARKLRDSQPRLWDYALQLRDKRFAARLLDTTAMPVLLHVSQRYPASRLCAAPVLPLARHPHIDSRVIVLDLMAGADEILGLSPEQITDRLFVASADLPEGVQRIGLKEVHTNKCPVLVQWQHLRDSDFGRLGIDAAAIEACADQLRPHAASLAEKVRQVFAVQRDFGKPDVDGSLYDGFVGDGDKHRFTDVRSTPADQLGLRDFGFKDPRMPELLFRYRARNWPHTLTAAEQQRWDDYRRLRLAPESGMSENSLEDFFPQIDELRQQFSEEGAKQILLDQLEDWGRQLQQQL